MSPANSERDGVERRYSIDQQDQPLIAIIEAVSDLRGVNPADLDPLQETIDIEAMTQLLRHPTADFYRNAEINSTTPPTVTFLYEGCRVVVTSNHIQVQTLD